MDLKIATSVLLALQGHTIKDFLEFFLGEPTFEDSATRHFFIAECPDLINALFNHKDTREPILSTCLLLCTEILMSEIAQMASKQSGWHFSAKTASAAQLEAFSIEEMAAELRSETPLLWRTIGCLLTSDPARECRRAQYLATETRKDAAGSMADGFWDDEDEYLEQDTEPELEDMSKMDDGGDPESLQSKRQRRARNRNQAVDQLRRVIIISMLLVTTNQKCNPIASIIGIFCHSTSTPELVVEMLAHAGLSISQTSIHKMITSLSAKAHIQVKELARTMLGSFVYDNFDMDFKSSQPTVEKPGVTLKHATSALVFPLAHGVTADDLKCSEELWRSNPLNPHILEQDRKPTRTWVDCLPHAHAVTQPESSPCREIRILAWHFRYTLVSFCEEFKKFSNDLGSPETVYQIPVAKTLHIPCRSMDINQSTNDGQAEIINNLCQQANLGDPEDFPMAEDISESRSIEKKPTRRLQFVVYVMGLFHYLMGCGDALWRMFIEPKAVREGPNTLFSQICKIRPHDSGKIASKYSFRLMHEVAHQCAFARILDCWRVKVRKDYPDCKELKDFAKRLNLKWADIENISLDLAKIYLDKPDCNDQEFRNNSLILARLLQYVELAHAMKHGDIGRVEATFLHWALVFKSVRKHKYAVYLIKIMNDMQYVYNERLRHAIRMNWLVNPTGKVDGFRGADWLNELLNLFTKVTYGSSGSARTFEWILKQSPLIEVFRHIHKIIEENFHLMHRSVRHAPPNIQNTLNVLCDLLEQHGAHELNEKRTSCKLTDHFRDGMRVFQTEKSGGVETTEEENLVEEIEYEDLNVIS
ncbi:hypothetical protein BDZ97DRAFT_1786939 [Flammula alnicola]|nr:hypothetical protein BDZ97DRAFT_1786939 [Flammula alnicola]